MSRVELEAISAARRPALDAMFQLYTHDFSEHWAGQDRGELPESGQFEAYPMLDLYWTALDRSAWFIRADGHLAGFAQDIVDFFLTPLAGLRGGGGSRPSLAFAVGHRFGLGLDLVGAVATGLAGEVSPRCPGEKGCDSNGSGVFHDFDL